MSAPGGSVLPPAKAQRVLACVQCQQRKVKCDRRFPCKNCVSSHAECIPAATLPQRPRRRRFPERELLDRVRYYEDLLRRNDIDFEPMHKQTANVETKPHVTDDGQPLSDAHPDWAPSPSTTVKSESTTKAKSYWDVVNANSRASDDDSSDSSADKVRESTVRKAWDQLQQSDDHLLFGWHKTGVDLSTLHPEPTQIFRLWQIYLDNVNPLLKVTHTPTLQGLIIDAASNVTSIKPPLEALMFGIYCMAVFSLDAGKCQATFGASRDGLLKKYQSGCQQALMNCRFLRSGDRDCLTALYLYLITARSSIDPFSLSSMLGIAIRLAQRMGLHSESACSTYPVFEAEMRRRLWWSLMFFDTRICEMADYKASTLTPIWDCKTPLHVGDFDLQPEMKELPTVQTKPTDSIFAVVRCEMSDFVRHCTFHLDFVNPALKAFAKDVQNGPVSESGELVPLEKMIEEKYLIYCNPEIPLQFMTIWVARGYLAKYNLFEHYSRLSASAAQQTDTQSDTVISYALKMLECDTMLVSSHLVRGYMWIVHLQFPFAAYLHIFQDLRRRPGGIHVKNTWEVASANFNARFASIEPGNFIFFKIFARVVLQAWKACEVAFSKSGLPVVPPRVVMDIRQRMAQVSQDERNFDTDQVNNASETDFDDYSVSMRKPMDTRGDDMLYDIRGQDFELSDITGYSYMQGQPIPDFHVDLSDWNAMDWNPMAGLF